MKHEFLAESLDPPLYMPTGHTAKIMTELLTNVANSVEEYSFAPAEVGHPGHESVTGLVAILEPDTGEDDPEIHLRIQITVKPESI